MARKCAPILTLSRAYSGATADLFVTSRRKRQRSRKGLPARAACASEHPLALCAPRLNRGASCCPIDARHPRRRTSQVTCDVMLNALRRTCWRLRSRIGGATCPSLGRAEITCTASLSHEAPHRCTASGARRECYPSSRSSEPPDEGQRVERRRIDWQWLKCR